MSDTAPVPVCHAPIRGPGPQPVTAIPIPIAKILNLAKDRKDRNTKRYFDHETALTNDIRTAGVRNPVKVIREEDLYRIICGQTRLNGARRAGQEFIPAIVLEGSMTPTRLLIEELADNNSTEAFDLVALAEICQELMAENGWKTQAELCRNVPIAKPAQVSKALSIFENLLDELKAQVRAGTVSGRLGYALSRVPRDRQLEVSRAVEGMNVQGAEEHIGALLAGKKSARAKPVKCRTPHGIVILIPGDLDFDTALADLNIPPEAIKRAQKQSLPLATVPMLMRSHST